MSVSRISRRKVGCSWLDLNLNSHFVSLLNTLHKKMETLKVTVSTAIKLVKLLSYKITFMSTLWPRDLLARLNFCKWSLRS
jgi:hypothetical protein